MTAVYPADDRLYTAGVKALYCEVSPEYEVALGKMSLGKEKPESITITKVTHIPVRSTAEAPIICAGTLVRRPFGERRGETIHFRHIAANGVDCVQREVEYLSNGAPKKCITWIKCVQCFSLDNHYISTMKARQIEKEKQDEIDAQESLNDTSQLLTETSWTDLARKESTQQGDGTNKKRRRWDEEVGNLFASELETPGLTREQKSILLSLQNWLEDVGKKLKSEEIKELAKINCVMFSGPKVDVLLRLGRTRYLGSPGPCPKCDYKMLDYVFESESLLAIPSAVRCKHYYISGGLCKFTEKLGRAYFSEPRPHCIPMCDTEGKLLERAGISAGSIIFREGGTSYVPPAQKVAPGTTKKMKVDKSAHVDSPSVCASNGSTSSS